MWRLHRYYLKELGTNFGITFLVMFAVVLVSLITRGINRSQGGGLIDAAKITVLFAVDAFPHLLAITFLVATVLTYTRAAQDRELIAIRAAGIGPRVPMMPALLIGLLLSVFGSFANHYVIPWVHYEKYRVIAAAVRNVFTNLKLGSDRIPILKTGYVMTFAERDGSDYLDCTIYCPPGRAIDEIDSPILRAERVSIPPLQDGQDTILIELEGSRDPVPTAEMDAYFGIVRIHIGVHDIADQGRRADRDEDVRSDQLLGEVLRNAHPRAHEAKYTLFKRCCFALLPTLLAPIGYCIAELMRMRGRVLALTVSLAPIALFYVGEAVGTRVMQATASSWSAWLPIAFLLVLGAPLCWRQLRR